MTPNKQHKRESFLHFIFRVIMILIGAGSAAVSIELFLVPNNFIDGGIIGVSLILDHLFMSNPLLNFALFVVLLNIPFMIFGYKYIGKTFLISTVIGIVGLALIESSLHHVEAITTQPILATVFGGFARFRGRPCHPKRRLDGRY